MLFFKLHHIFINFNRYLLFSQYHVRLMSPNKNETGHDLQSEIIKWVRAHG